MKLRNTISKALLVMSLASAFTMSGVVSNYWPIIQSRIQRI
ncbi:hypothetical protein RVY78_09280 [Veillonella sp. YH-vei2232]|uniref:Uncharacterized protein n=1 Tax=Veillonella absiana TaxID=3079305 RepID=A0ABU3ZBJ5_9FIRM|nr:MULTISPECIES: hypothetical protein [unclassified Veillonella]MDV5064137.1 hypothetical protein [Veillonella sp. YH-vei2232]MDV5089072.1 hypothetical protein [Veillonella sp. YH-vei2233]